MGGEVPGVGPGPVLELVPPRAAGVELGRRAEREVHHHHLELVAGRDVSVEGHRGGAQPLRDRGHGDRGQAVGVRYLDRGRPDRLDGQGALRAASSGGVVEAPQGSYGEGEVGHGSSFEKTIYILHSWMHDLRRTKTVYVLRKGE